MAKTFRELKAWQKAMDLVVVIYQFTRSLPESERYGLISQMWRAAISVPTHIAEGYGRQNRPEWVRFLRIARGSLMEFETQLLLVQRLEMAHIPSHVCGLREECNRVLQGVIRSLQPAQKPI